MHEYKTARILFAFGEAIAWVIVAAGVITLLTGLVGGMAMEDSFTGGRTRGFGLLGLYPGLIVTSIGIFLVMCVQIGRATINTAANTGQILLVAREQLQITKGGYTGTTALSTLQTAMASAASYAAERPDNSIASETSAPAEFGGPLPQAASMDTLGPGSDGNRHAPHSIDGPPPSATPATAEHGQAMAARQQDHYPVRTIAKPASDPVVDKVEELASLVAGKLKSWGSAASQAAATLVEKAEDVSGPRRPAASAPSSNTTPMPDPDVTIVRRPIVPAEDIDLELELLMSEVLKAPAIPSVDAPSTDLDPGQRQALASRRSA